MNHVTQTITLTSDQHYGRRLPPQALGHALNAIPTIVRQSIAMAFRARSNVRGPRPHWLKATSDLRFLDHQGDDETILVFEVPKLGEAAAELYQQQEFWSTRPDPGLTGLDLLGDVLRDVAAHNEDSDRFDKSLLNTLVGFKKVLNGSFQELRLDPSTIDPKPPTQIDAEVIRTAEEFKATTPLPQRVRVAGTLDMVRASTQSFALRLDDGQEVRGVLLSGTILETALHLNQRVLVLGNAIYRASGRLLRIDADEISVAEGESSFFSRIPPAKKRRFDLKEVLHQQSHKKGVGAIMGRWLGDETDEQVDQALRDIS